VTGVREPLQRVSYSRCTD